MIYGNHKLRKGDIVRIYRWEPELLDKAARFYNIKPWCIDDMKFIVIMIDYHLRKIRLIPKNTSGDVLFVDMDATSLMKVGTLAESN